MGRQQQAQLIGKAGFHGNSSTFSRFGARRFANKK
jgi:hypothetical protein